MDRTVEASVPGARNLHWHAACVDRQARQRLNGHRSGVVWMTGLSGAGKSTLAGRLDQDLHAAGIRSYVLDGDNVRHGLNRDLGFDARDRSENIRRVAEVARLMADAGLVVLTAFISPFRSDRALARALFAPGEFLEVHVDVSLAQAQARDPKGLYAKARRGELRDFTGLDSAYEPPTAPELRIDTGRVSVDEAVGCLRAALERQGWLTPTQATR